MVPIRALLTRVNSAIGRPPGEMSGVLGFAKIRLRLHSPGGRESYRSRVAVVSAAVAVAALVLVAPAAQADNRPGGWGSGTLRDADLHGLVAQMTLTEEAGMVHGEGDPPSSAGANANC